MRGIRGKTAAALERLIEAADHLVERMAETGCNAVGIDWTVNLSDIRNRVGNTVAIQGNLDPAILLGTPEYIRKEVKEILESYGHGSGHVFNLGHGILPEVPFENVKVLVDAVHEFSIHYHKQ